MKPSKFILTVLLTGISFYSTRVAAQNTFPPAGFTGIGTTTPFNPLQVVGLTQFSSTAPLATPPTVVIDDILETDTYPRHYFHSSFEVHSQANIAGSTGPSNTNFIITSDGNVGIKNAYPNSELDVNGNVNSTSVSTGNISCNSLNASTSVSTGNISCNSLDASTSISSSSLASSSDKMVVANTSGTLAPMDLPTLAISGQTLSIKSGTTTLGTVTLPTAPAQPGDNLGNHRATQALSMSAYPINGVQSMAFTGGGTFSVLAGGKLLYNFPFNVGGALDVNGTGNFNGNVKVNGDIDAGVVRSNGMVLTSDKRFKKNIMSIGNPEALYTLNPYQYRFRANEFPGMNFDDKIHFGLIAQELREVFPDLVSVLDKEGHYGINYTELIPLLIQAAKAQNDRISELERQIAKISGRPAGTDIAVTAPATQSESVLYQNAPNPFSKETSIRYTISEAYSAAYIGIYDMNGRELKRLVIGSASGTVSVSGSELQNGMYLYSLIVNGRIIDSKKMLLSND